MKLDGWTLLILAGVGTLVVVSLGASDRGGDTPAQEIEWRADEVRIAACSLWGQGVSPLELAPGIALAVYPEHFDEDANPRTDAAARLLAEIKQYASQVTGDDSICFGGEG